MSMRNEVTQGSIISNIRSQKYLKVSCFGIVISARCDIAQNKVDCVHSALNKLYLACSRAKYKVFILGTIPRGDSSCLQYALQNGFIEKKICPHGE